MNARSRAGDEIGNRPSPADIARDLDKSTGEMASLVRARPDRPLGEGIAIMSFARVRPCAGAAAIVLALAGGLTPAAAWATTRTPAKAAAPAATSYSVAGSLSAVAASSAANAWAVGAAGKTGTKPLIVRWNGSKWSSVPTGAAAGTDLIAVTTTSAGNAWAAGVNYTTRKSVILRWTGSAWKRVAFSAPAGTYLSSISATSRTSAWVVGTYGTPITHMIALRWNGKTWKRATLPKLPLQAHEGTGLNSVSAVSGSNAWAVGSFVSQYAGPGAGFTLHWNGRSWKRVASPPAGQGDPVAVAATSASNAWLVGCPCQGGPAGAVTGHWNGHTWKTVATPVAKSPAGGDGTAVAARGRLAWAAGAYCHCSSGNFTLLPMLLRWTGSAWKRTTVPASKISIFGVAVTGTANAWAVGATTGQKTVILHWNGKAWH
jgi:hypothetical protein